MAFLRKQQPGHWIDSCALPPCALSATVDGSFTEALDGAVNLCSLPGFLLLHLFLIICFIIQQSHPVRWPFSSLRNAQIAVLTLHLPRISFSVVQVADGGCVHCVLDGAALVFLYLLIQLYLC